MSGLIYLDTGEIFETDDDGFEPIGEPVATLQHAVLDDDAHTLGLAMAAAPELLAELIDLRRRFHNACRSGGSDEEFVLGSTPGADAAIAKATSHD